MARADRMTSWISGKPLDTLQDLEMERLVLLDGGCCDPNGAKAHIERICALNRKIDEKT